MNDVSTLNKHHTQEPKRDFWVENFADSWETNQNPRHTDDHVSKHALINGVRALNVKRKLLEHDISTYAEAMDIIQ